MNCQKDKAGIESPDSEKIILKDPFNLKVQCSNP